jgi:parallel beta-helix repeat protein
MPVLIALMVVLACGDSSARIRLVKADGTGEAPTIQTGIDLCGPGDTVLVASGIYRGDGNRDLDFHGKSIVVIAESRYDPAVSDSTVIDCEGSRSYPHRAFYFHSAETNDAVVEGFVITNGGTCQYCYESVGGAIACDSYASPTIRHNTISYCSAAEGGGIYCTGSSAPIISDNTIYACTARPGAAIYSICSSAPVISGNHIYANDSGYYGAISCISSSPVIVDNDIHDNSSAWYVNSSQREYGLSGRGPAVRGSLVSAGNSGGIVCSSCPSVLVNGNRIHANGGHDSGGISIANSSATIKGNELWGNGADGNGGIQAVSSSVTIVGNVIHENTSLAGAIGCYGGSIAMIDSNYVHGNGLGTANNVAPGIEISSSRATIRGNEISGNRGGGVSFTGDSCGTIENNRILDNGLDDQDSYAVGGILCASPISIIGNTVSGNIGKGGWGGGITCSSAATIEGNIIANNSSSSFGGRGGGIVCDAFAPSILNNTIVSNTAAAGGGIYVGAESQPILTANIVSHNRVFTCQDCPPFAGGGIFSESGVLDVSCCDVFANEGGNYVGIADQTGLENNISEDPLFCPSGYAAFSLRDDSPCSPYVNVECGLIGANPALCAQTDSGGSNEHVTAYELGQNYPNPFNPTTTIVFDLRASALVSLRVYDAGGRLVRVLIEERRDSGRNEITWDGKDDGRRDVASGVYFYRLMAGPFSETKKMVLLR